MKNAKDYFDQILHKGDNVQFEQGFSVFNGSHNIHLGSHIYLVDALINAGNDLGKVTIEDFVFFGHGVKVIARGHDYTVFDSDRQNAIVEKPIHIKRGAWIGSGSIILGGVTVGEHAVVAAGSVVVKDVDPYAIVAGNPARKVREIKDNISQKKESLFSRLKTFLTGR
jgi:acetyltransferase-like isoleucine patch superfamily enzyme